MTKCRDAIGAMQQCRSVTLKQLQSLIGLLNYAYKVVIPGRAFLRKVINLTIGVSKPHFHVRLNPAWHLEQI